MPYHVGEKGSYGCSGYPAVKDDGTVMGCHKTRAAAAGQIYAINQSEGNIGKAMYNHKEGDIVMGMTTEGVVVGRIEHIMTEGGTYGVPGTEYAIESTPENPAMAVRIYEQEDDIWYPTAYSIGMMYSDAVPVTDIEIGAEEEDLEELERLAKASPCWDGYVQRGMKPGENGRMVPNCIPVQKYDEAFSKAETYSPNSGMKSAARRALKWKEDGKATGAGTPVGWGRASDIVAGRAMSISVVRRMYSFFSRHEVDKKGKDFYNTSNPSNGRIMWDAWGGDAGFAWSRAIVRRNEEKMLFSDFGKDYTKTSRMVFTVENKKNVTPN